MTTSDLKIGIVNAVTFILSFSNIEVFLKITLLLFSIVLTALKIIEHLKKDKNETNKKL